MLATAAACRAAPQQPLRGTMRHRTHAAVCGAQRQDRQVSGDGFGSVAAAGMGTRCRARMPATGCVGCMRGRALCSSRTFIPRSVPACMAHGPPSPPDATKYHEGRPRQPVPAGLGLRGPLGLGAPSGAPGAWGRRSPDVAPDVARDLVVHPRLIGRLHDDRLARAWGERQGSLRRLSRRSPWRWTLA